MAEKHSELDFEGMCTSATDNYDSDGTHECSLEAGHEYVHKCFCGEEW